MTDETRTIVELLEGAARTARDLGVEASEDVRRCCLAAAAYYTVAARRARAEDATWPGVAAMGAACVAAAYHVHAGATVAEEVWGLVEYAEVPSDAVFH